MEAAKRGIVCHASFNGIQLEAAVGSSPAGIVAAFHRDLDAKANAFDASPEGIAAVIARRREIATAQAQIDLSVVALDALDFSDLDAVIGWFETVQDATDQCGVRVPKAAILAAFSAAGFEPDANCGDAFDDDRENVARYIIGQALSTLRFLAIHGTIHGFAKCWREKFSAENGRPSIAAT